MLKYIGPSLEKYKGCDILDLNPGIGLWSRKLHEFLQPRSHVLLETSPELFREDLDPLLNNPGSKYKLYHGDIGRYETYDKLVEDGVFAHQKRVDPKSPDAQKLNDTLLVTGSFMWDPNPAGFGFNSLPKQLLLHFARRAWSNEAFHAYGPVRTLFWMPSEEFKTSMAKGQNSVSKYGVYLDFLGKHTQVVSAGLSEKKPGRQSHGRAPQYEIESLVRAMRRGKENGMELPAHRRENVHDFADELAEMSGGTGILNYSKITEYLEDQERAGKSTSGLSLGTDIKAIHLDIAKEADPTKFRDPETGKVTPLDIKRQTYRSCRAHVRRYRIRTDTNVDMGESIYDLECKILKMQDGPKKETALKELEELTESYESIRERLLLYRTAAATDIDDRLSVRSPVPRLQWDDRPYEPLVMKPEEVWPAQGVALVDSEPHPRPEGYSPQIFEWIQDFVYALYQSPTRSVVKALNGMQPGASSLIDEVPALKDPAKGGRLNMDQLRVRMLTKEMVMGLCMAYRAWPFRSPNAMHSKYFQIRVGGDRTKKQLEHGY